MTPDWTPLRQELRIWQNDGLTLPIWWRDDDAVSSTKVLDDLVALSEQMSIPVHIAVIPKFADETLVQQVADHKGQLIPLVHGWAHENHAQTGQKKAEFGTANDESIARAKDGLARMQSLFGPLLTPCFVPPWNRMDIGLMPALAQLGYQKVSSYGPRADRFPASGLEQINTHIDPINWRGDRSAVPAEQLIAGLVQTLKDRRSGQSDTSEPLGLLTHHLVHDTAIWTITKAILSELLNGPATVFSISTRT